jgi:signal transduction histidine kinase/CheY-like chemotaxis protein
MDDCVSVEEVLCTGELELRATRQPDFAAENRALCALVQALADAPDNILQTMAEIMLDTFGVGSAGCSVLVDKGDGARFYWPAIAGAWQGQIGGGTPRDFGPCGDVLDQQAPLLFKQPQRRYGYLRDVTPGVEECLLVPFHVDGTAVGTLWLVAHDTSRKFDAEDLRQLLSLGKFASAAYEATNFSARMRGVNEALLLGSLQQHETALAEERQNALLREEILGRELFEVELRQAMLSAKQANLSKSDFLTNMSHELRTPLSSILGFAHVMELSSPPLSEVQKRCTTQIQKAGWYLAELINEVLDLAQIEAGKLSLQMEAVPLDEVLRECQAMIEPLAKTRAITIGFPSLEQAVFVHGDRKRFKQVLINLLSNAIKYNRHAGTVTVECSMEGAERIRISVSDTGEGLTEDQLSQLFQLFNRLGQDAHAVNGTGIGLVMTKRLTELMGGTVGVESTVGAGSIFWVELTLAQAPETHVAPAPAAHSTSAASGVAESTLLYVEDNSSSQMMIKDLMSHRPDIRLLSAWDGHKGIALARHALPDVILLDIKLPDIDGMRVAAELAGDAATAHIPVIGLSANAMPEDISQAMEAGFFRYLTKPVNVRELMETLDQAIEFNGRSTARQQL